MTTHSTNNKHDVYTGQVSENSSDCSSLLNQPIQQPTMNNDCIDTLQETLVKNKQNSSHPTLSKSAQAIPRSLIRDVFDKVRKNPNAISLCLGEPSSTAAPHIIEAACQSLNEGKTKYTDVLGIPEFRQAVSQYTQRVKGLTYDPASEIQVASGAAYGLYVVLKALLDVGDEVIIPSPFFVSYDADVLMCGGIPVPVALQERNQCQVNAHDIEQAITPRTKAIILNTPSNPTGAVTPYAELERIAQLCKKYGIWIVSDEVYHPFVFNDNSAQHTQTVTSAPSIAQVPGMKDYTIIVDSLSKTYAMTGWRIGYILAPECVIHQTGKLAEMIQSSVNSTAQYGAVAAMLGSDEHILAMRDEYYNKRNIVIEELNTCDAYNLIRPQGAFYGFINIDNTGLSDTEFSDLLLTEEQVAVVPGRAFGKDGRGFVRISYAGDPVELREGLRRFKRFALKYHALHNK